MKFFVDTADTDEIRDLAATGLDDLGSDGMNLISDICEIYSQYENFTTEVLVASIRGPLHLVEAARMGAHVATMPPNVLRQLYKHPLTDAGLAAFLADWEKTGQSILDA
jgi:transaldolase